MARKVTIFRSTTGLNNAVDPARLRLDLKTGECELAAAYNVDVEQGRLSRRRGYTQKRSEPSHSLFVHDAECLFVSGGTLYRLNGDYSRTALRSNITDNPVAFCHAANVTYYSNGLITGKVPLLGESSPWTCEDYVGPVTDRTFDNAPAGHLLAFHDSRVLVAQENVCWYSEKFAYSRFDLASNFIQEASSITLLAPVEGGIYIGTANQVFWYEGADFKTAKRDMKGTGALPGTSVVVAHTAVNRLLGTNFTAPCVMWAAKDGIYVGAPGGFVTNITEGRLVLPDISKGCAVAFGDRYLTLLQA